MPFAGAYLALAGVALLAMALLAFIEFPPVPPAPQAAPAPADGRWAQIMRQPVFIVAAGAGALGYGVMNLLMAATPIAMQTCGLPFSDVALVLEWHVIGMFAPGFFTGHLIKRFGALPIMGVGVAAQSAVHGVALSGVELHQFLVALFLLGLGWNFLFTGGTTLALEPTGPRKKTRRRARSISAFLRCWRSFLRVGRAGHDAGLDPAELGLAAACGGNGRGAGCGLLCVVAQVTMRLLEGHTAFMLI